MEPTRIPMTTQSLRPKIEVFFESCVSTKAASYTVMAKRGWLLEDSRKWVAFVLPGES